MTGQLFASSAHLDDLQAAGMSEERVLLLLAASQKPIQRLSQIDVFPDAYLSFTDELPELRKCQCTRIQYAAGTPKEKVIRDLHQALAWLQLPDYDEASN